MINERIHTNDRDEDIYSVTFCFNFGTTEWGAVMTVRWNIRVLVTGDKVNAPLSSA